MTDLAITRILVYQETKLLDLTHEFNLKKQQLFSSASLLPASQRVQEQDQESLALEKKRELAFLARLCLVYAFVSSRVFGCTIFICLCLERAYVVHWCSALANHLDYMLDTC